jgi:hypothetical protein
LDDPEAEGEEVKSFFRWICGLGDTPFPSGKAWFYLDFSPYTKKFPMPIAWQGWATLAAMIAWTVGSIWLLDAIGVPRHSWILTVGVMLSVVVFVFAVYSKTRIEY